MNKFEKLNSMNKILRELEDVSNSCTAVLKKGAQIEAENMNLGNKLLDHVMPHVFENMNAVVTETAALLVEFTAVRDAYVAENKLELVDEPVVL